uniref:Uncharacterized protein n=1 Tax=Janibacter limosus TaxID=53458 RepID=A0AC61U268_9MICO|nr:hypothetical protein [Janibacter limosus]
MCSVTYAAGRDLEQRPSPAHPTRDRRRGGVPRRGARARRDGAPLRPRAGRRPGRRRQHRLHVPRGLPHLRHPARRPGCGPAQVGAVAADADPRLECPPPAGSPDADGNQRHLGRPGPRPWSPWQGSSRPCSPPPQT